MNRVCKKIMSLLGLAFVIGITAVASGMPPVQEASAAGGDVNVQFKVTGQGYVAQIISPVEGSMHYSEDAVSARISYAAAGSITVYLTYPDGRYVEIDTITPTEDSGEFDVALPMDGYGDYVVSVSGRDMAGSAMPSDAREFAYRAVTAEPNEDGDKIVVEYGTNVCRLGFQVYKADDTTKQNPLLNPEYIIDVEQTGENPNKTEVEIPGFSELGPDEFTVIVKAYDCLNGDVIDSDGANMNGVILPPKTGAISILGMTISQADYLISGLVVFVLVAIFAIVLLNRRKSKRA